MGIFPKPTTPSIPEGFRVIRVDDVEVGVLQITYATAKYRFDTTTVVNLLEPPTVNQSEQIEGLEGSEVAITLVAMYPNNLSAPRRIAEIWELPCPVLKDR